VISKEQQLDEDKATRLQKVAVTSFILLISWAGVFLLAPTNSIVNTIAVVVMCTTGIITVGCAVAIIVLELYTLFTEPLD
jgi:hypothetical protein